MQQVDSKLVMDTMRTMDEQIADNISTDRLVAMLAVSFGVLATLLAAIGLYGVLAYVDGAAHARNRHSHGAGRATAAKWCGWCCTMCCGWRASA